MHVTALVGGLGQPLADRRLEGGMVVGDHELNRVQAALAQTHQEVPPARPALAVRQFNAEHLAAAVPIDTDGDQHRLAGDLSASRTRS